MSQPNELDFVSLEKALKLKDVGYPQSNSKFYWKIFAFDNPEYQEPFIAGPENSGADYRVAAPLRKEIPDDLPTEG